MNKRFIDLLKSKRELYHNLLVGDVEMKASLVWDENCVITDYGIHKFRPLMEAQCIVKDEYIEVFCDDYHLGEEFVFAAAGFISSKEYEKIFICH